LIFKSNLLISNFKSDLQVKVADFGLSQHLSSYYKEYSNLAEEAVVPIRWTAPEVFKTHKVTQKSDVWSFGAAMYEILEGGAVPYYQLFSNKEVVDQVLKGLKLEKPIKTPPSDGLWDIMQSCWLEPDQRPTFKEIHHQFSLLLTSSSKSSIYKWSPL